MTYTYNNEADFAHVKVKKNKYILLKIKQILD